MEQLNFNYQPEKEEKRPEDNPAESAPASDLDALPLETLQKLYQKSVGINPALRGFDRNTLITGIENPEAEHARIREIDQASDRDDIDHTYRRS